ncbi:MAG: hypothetical protein HFJ43_05465 [Clostridia bacterium]|nr:hypothetical protein [Clostridia bacterium]
MKNIKLVSDLENEYQKIKKLTNVKYENYIENLLDEAEKELDNPNTKYLTHEEVFSSVRRIIK